MTKLNLSAQKHLERVRRIALALPETSERLSHGEPAFFVQQKMFAMFANNHHHDGHLGLWIPAPEGFQEGLIRTAPEIFYMPPYVGKRGWVGVELEQIGDPDLEFHLNVAWEIVAPKRLVEASSKFRT